jgi:uncharacterized protein (DUF1810 family)
LDVQMEDRFDLERFVLAQDEHGTYARATDELRRGHKTSHWMWFVFPQIAGLGHSAMAQRYAISSLDEAKAYLAHPVLGPRLLECAGLVLDANGSSAAEIFGDMDAMKLRSAMTLFLRASPPDSRFGRVLDEYFDGEPDPATDARIAG